jgi:hypothetical protein
VIQTVAANVSAGCGSNIGDIALSSPASVLATVQLGYPIIRNMMCLQECVSPYVGTVKFSLYHDFNLSTNFNFCMSKNWTTAALQLAMVNDPVAVVEQLIAKSFNTDCNECTKAAFQLYNKAFPQINGTGLITDACGANFAGLSSTLGFRNIFITDYMRRCSHPQQPSGQHQTKCSEWYLQRWCRDVGCSRHGYTFPHGHVDRHFTIMVASGNRWGGLEIG